MSEKRRGLGRGLGALIPTSSEGKRPVDVFFPSSVGESEDSQRESGSATGADKPADGESTAADGSVITIERDSSPAEVSSFATVTVEELDSLVTDESGPVEDGLVERTPRAESAETVEPPESLETPDPDSETGGTLDADSLEGADGSGVAETRSTADTDQQAHIGDADLVDDVSRETDDATASATGINDMDWTGQAADDLVPVPGARFAEISVESIRPNPMQPRTVFDEAELEQLVGSIKEIGVLQPIVVRPAPSDGGSYELIMGERRWRATQAAGLETIPAIVRETEDSDLLRDALLENLHRSALNPLEEAAAYRQLLDDFGCTHEELADRISRSRPQISNTLRLLRLPPLVQRRVAAGVLSAGHARALLGLTDGGEIERLAQRIVAEGLSVRATEEIVAMGEGQTRAPRVPRAGQRSAAIDELATRLSDRFETRVKVDLGAKKGRLTVEFASVEDLNRILDLMAPEDPGLLRR